MLIAEIENGARIQKVGMMPAWNEKNNDEWKIHRIGA